MAKNQQRKREGEQTDSPTDAPEALVLESRVLEL